MESQTIRAEVVDLTSVLDFEDTKKLWKEYSSGAFDNLDVHQVDEVIVRATKQVKLQ